MHTSTFAYKGTHYTIRHTIHGDIAPLALKEQLLYEGEIPLGKEERKIDNSFIYYADEEEMKLSDKQLLKLIYG